MSDVLTWQTVSLLPVLLSWRDKPESTDWVSEASASAAAGLSRLFPNKPWKARKQQSEAMPMFLTALFLTYSTEPQKYFDYTSKPENIHILTAGNTNFCVQFFHLKKHSRQLDS